MELAAIIGAAGSFLTAVGVLITCVYSVRNHNRIGNVSDAIEGVRKEVVTGNANTAGDLLVQNEGRRIAESVPHDLRTTDQQHYVDKVPNEPPKQ